MTFSLPPIAKLSERLLVEIEQAVRGFPRYHKYAIGNDLRAQAREVVRLCHRAWRDRQHQVQWTDRLRWAVDELKVSLQLGSQLRAFQSFAVFEQLVRLAEDLGRQAGGWHRTVQSPQQGQKPTPRGAPARAQTLSTRAASSGANP